MLEKAKQYAAELAQWNTHIVAIAALEMEEGAQHDKVNLVCTFEPEPPGNVVGFFWIANLLVRDEYEGLSEQLEICFLLDLGFKIGRQVFLPGGEILDASAAHTQLWPARDGGA